MSRRSSKNDRLYLPEDADLAAMVRMAYALSSTAEPDKRQNDFRLGALDDEAVASVLAQMRETAGSPVLFRAGRIHDRDVMLTVFREEGNTGRFFVNPHWLEHTDQRQDDLLTYMGVEREAIAAARLAPRTDHEPRPGEQD